MHLLTSTLALLAVITLSGACVEGGETVDPTSVEGCRESCVAHKGSACISAEEYDACIGDCAEATQEQIAAWNGCNATACDPNCILLPGGPCGPACFDMAERNCVLSEGACMGTCDKLNDQEQAEFEDCVASELPSQCDTPLGGAVCLGPELP